MLSVSVIIPTVGRVDFLTRSIESVLNQTVPPQEIFVVNDSDSELDLTVYGESIRILNTGGYLGGGAARNHGVAHSSSDIVMFLDDDDAWKPEKIEKQLECFSFDCNVRIVFSGRDVVRDENLSLVKRTIFPIKKSLFFSDLCHQNYIGSTSSVAIYRKDWQLAGGFDKNLKCYQDYDLWMSILCIDKSAIALFDGEVNVIYTVFCKLGMQISSSGDRRHQQMATYLISKWSPALNNFQSNCFRASLCLSIAKSLVGRKRFSPFFFVLKSLYIKPSVRAWRFLVVVFFNVILLKNIF